jgi:hypothetical protein
MLSRDSDWFVNWTDVPSVVRLADVSLAAHWLQKSAASTYARTMFAPPFLEMTAERGASPFLRT